MSLYEEIPENSDAYGQLDLIETNQRFLMIVTLISLINSKFYNPVSFFIEYITNKNTQKLVNFITNTNQYQFTVDYLKCHPNVAKSRKVSNAIKKLK